MYRMKFLFFSVTTLFLCSCASIQPEAPEIIVKSVPVNVQPASTIVVPIKINLTPYFKETDKSMENKRTVKM